VPLVCVCNPSYLGSRIRKMEFQSQSGQTVHKTLSWKYLTQKRAGRVAQVVEHLPSNCEVLSSNSSTAKKNLWSKWMLRPMQHLLPGPIRPVCLHLRTGSPPLTSLMPVTGPGTHRNSWHDEWLRYQLWSLSLLTKIDTTLSQEIAGY
jgi:hypothetical protein